MDSKTDLEDLAARVTSGQVNRLAGMLAGPTTHQVRICPDSDVKGEFVATACTFVHRDDIVVFENLTRGSVQLQFSSRILFGVDGLDLADKTPARLVVGPCARAAEYPFAAYCHKGGRFARGGSMPIIIVEPKG